MKARILILNFNGKDLLADCMPSVTLAAGKSCYNCRVSVIDNASTDGSVEYIKHAFPSVSVLPLQTNRVLCSYNDCVRDTDEDIVILLNNDIRVEPDFVDPLVEAFQKDPKLFMSTPKTLDADGKISGSITKAYIKWGIFWSAATYPGFEKDADREDITFSAGGIVAFDRKKFLELRGYDDLYLPGTVEDCDICFRSWKRGWKCVYQPKSIAYHIGQVSFTRAFGKRRTRIINFRNLFLFMWKNISDRKLIFEHIVFTPWRLLYSLVTGKTELCAGFFQALPRLGKAIKRRRYIDKESQVSDKDIFDLFRV